MQNQEELSIILLDGGIFHKAHSLHIPANVILEFLPAYSPELDPIERLWQDIKERIANKIFDTLGALKDRVANIVKDYASDYIKSLTGYPYILEAVNAVVQ
jgi:transposase